MGKVVPRRNIVQSTRFVNKLCRVHVAESATAFTESDMFSLAKAVILGWVQTQSGVIQKSLYRQNN